jgi:hypothetical protein
MQGRPTIATPIVKPGTKLGAILLPSDNWHDLHFVETLNPNLVVNVCVTNQSKGHWLLSNVLNIVINFIGIGIWTKSPYWGETFDQFDVEFHLLKKNMRQRLWRW